MTETTNYIFYNNYDEEGPRFVSLTNEQVRLLKYLEKEDCLDDAWNFDEIGNHECKKI